MDNPSPTGDFWLPSDVKFRQPWLCLWADAQGRYVATSDERYLSGQSYTKFDSKIEDKVRKVAEGHGIFNGRPVWVAGRKISDMEADDQMERLLDGKIPDEREATLDAIEQEWMRKRGMAQE